jgi:integrase
VLEGNLGLRISDILKLRPCDIVRDGDRYRLEITEQKTGKRPRVHRSPGHSAVYRKLLLAQRHRPKRPNISHHREGHTEAAPYRVRLPGL